MVSPESPEFDRLIAGIGAELTSRHIAFMLIGGQAVLLHGEPRLTQDIDVTLGVGPTHVAEILAACKALEFEALPDDPAAFAERTFVLPVVDPVTRVRVDFIFSTTPYEQLAIGRAVLVEVAGVQVTYASAEDLILHKLFAGRPRDLEDIRGVVARQGETLEWEYIERWAEEFSSVEGRENLPQLVQEIRAAL